MKSFARFRLDPVNQCLWRRADSEHEDRVLLTPRAFSILTYLVNHAGRLVTHDELLKAVWYRSVVEPHTLKKHIVEVRTALGDRPKNSLFIETLHKRGYWFIAPVSESIAASPTARSGSLARGDGANRPKGSSRPNPARMDALLEVRHGRRGGGPGVDTAADSDG